MCLPYYEKVIHLHHQRFGVCRWYISLPNLCIYGLQLVGQIHTDGWYVWCKKEITRFIRKYESYYTNSSTPIVRLPFKHRTGAGEISLERSTVDNTFSPAST